MGKVKEEKNQYSANPILYQFPMGKVKRIINIRNFRKSQVSIPYGKGKEKENKELAKKVGKHQFPMGKVEELSKSLIWHTTPMQQRSKSGFIRDWLSATAKGDKYRCTFHYCTSIPYGKGKVKTEPKCNLPRSFMYQFPMGKVKLSLGSLKGFNQSSINSLWER